MPVVLFAITLCLTALTSLASAQSNALFLDAGGAGGYYSLNLQLAVKSSQDINLLARTGLTVNHLLDFERKLNPDFLINAGTHLTYGSKHRAELAAGILMGSFAVAEPNAKTRDWSISPFAELGYRLEPPDKRFIFRIYYSPYLKRFNNLVHWGGIGFGYKLGTHE